MNQMINSKYRLSPLKVILLVAVTVAAGYMAIVAFAAGATLYLSPDSKTLNNNESMTVSVRVNTGGEEVNAVQANLYYPSDKLQFVSIDASNSAFGIEAESSGGGGSVEIGRASITPKSGDLLIATVTFKAVTGSGSAYVGFSDDSSVVRSSDNADILSVTNGGTYSFTSSTSPSPPPAPSPSPSPTPSSSSSPPPAATSPQPTGENSNEESAVDNDDPDQTVDNENQPLENQDDSENNSAAVDNANGQETPSSNNLSASLQPYLWISVAFVLAAITAAALLSSRVRSFMERIASGSKRENKGPENVSSGEKIAGDDMTDTNANMIYPNDNKDGTLT